MASPEEHYPISKLGSMGRALCSGPLSSIKTLLTSPRLVFDMVTLDTAMVHAATRGDAESVVFLHNHGATVLIPAYAAAKVHNRQHVIDALYQLKRHPGSIDYTGFKGELKSDGKDYLITNQLDVIKECSEKWGVPLYHEYIEEVLKACDKYNRGDVAAIVLAQKQEQGEQK